MLPALAIPPKGTFSGSGSVTPFTLISVKVKIESCQIIKNIVETESITHQKVNVSETEGKYAETKIEFIYYDEQSDTSVIYAYPITGRMHQIRVHLKSVNHPIVNDSLYNDFNEWNETVQIDENWKKENCKECQNGMNISKEELFLCCVELEIEYQNQKKKFTIDNPIWSKKEFDIIGYLNEFFVN